MGGAGRELGRPTSSAPSAGDYLWFLIGISAIVIAVSLFGGFPGLL